MFTLINVVTVSLLTKFVDLKFIDSLAQNIACVITDSSGNVFQAGLMARAVLGALFSGLSSSLAFAVGASNGGSDTIGYYLSMRKSTSAGKYFVMINSVIIGLFSILSVFESISIYGSFSSVYIANAFIIILFGVVYQLVISLVVDLINRRNKKEQIQIITKQENLSKLLLANIPHGATLVRSKGAFTGEERIIIYIIVSIHETRNVVNLVRSADPKSFINITSVKQVYGRFFIKPIK